MKTIQPSRVFITFFILALILTFLVGTVLAFSDAKAAAYADQSATEVNLPPAASPTSQIAEIPASANMTGIIILGIMIVAIIAIGLLWGRRVTHK